MPYITQARREVINPFRKGIIATEEIATAGELNYAITVLIKTYFENSSNYQSINDVVGALEGAKAEFQRKVVSKYEDGKEKENGEVY